MTNRFLRVLVAAFVLSARAALAEDISASMLLIKENADPARRQMKLLSADPGIQSGEIDAPESEGGAIHLYTSAMVDRFCRILPAGEKWKARPGKWKFKDKATKTVVSAKDGKLKVVVGAGVTFSLADQGTQNFVNAVVRFGDGTRYCMKCQGNKKNDASAFQALDCLPSPCDTEWVPCGQEFGPSVCLPGNTTDLSDDGCSCSGNLECAGVCPVAVPRYCVGGDTGPFCAPGNTLDLSADGCPCSSNLECEGVCPVTIPTGSNVRRCLS